MRSFPLASTLQMSLATWMDSLRPPAQECSSSSEPDDLSRDGAGPRISSRAARKSARVDTLRRCNDLICRQWLGVSCNLFQNCEKQREPEPTASSISWTLTIARRSRQRSPHPANVMSLTVTLLRHETIHRATFATLRHPRLDHASPQKRNPDGFETVGSHVLITLSMCSLGCATCPGTVTEPPQVIPDIGGNIESVAFRPDIGTASTGTWAGFGFRT